MRKVLNTTLSMIGLASISSLAQAHYDGSVHAHEWSVADVSLAIIAILGAVALSIAVYRFAQNRNTTDKGEKN